MQKCVKFRLNPRFGIGSRVIVWATQPSEKRRQEVAVSLTGVRERLTTIAAKIATAAATPAEERSETGKKARPSQQTMSVTPETRTVCPAVPARTTIVAQT